MVRLVQIQAIKWPALKVIPVFSSLILGREELGFSHHQVSWTRRGCNLTRGSCFCGAGSLSSFPSPPCRPAASLLYSTPFHKILSLHLTTRAIVGMSVVEVSQCYSPVNLQIIGLHNLNWLTSLRKALKVSISVGKWDITVQNK